MWSKTLARLYNQEEKEKLEASIYDFLDDHRKLPLEDEITATLISPSNKSGRKGKLINGKRPNSIANALILSQTQDQSVKRKIFYCEFLNLILEAQLRQHELYLTPFNDLFKHVDKDADGVINHVEFRELISLMEFKDLKANSANVINE